MSQRDGSSAGTQDRSSSTTCFTAVEVLGSFHFGSLQQPGWKKQILVLESCIHRRQNLVLESCIHRRQNLVLESCIHRRQNLVLESCIHRRQNLVLESCTHRRQNLFLGKWYFKAAVSHREADIHKFKVFDNMLFIMEETANDTLKLSGHMRMGDDCMKQTWTYHLQPARDDLVLEGRPQRRTLLWSGRWAGCLDCIILQEIEPPLTETDSEDSLSRFMLYARQKRVDSEVVTKFLKRTACNNMDKSVILPQEKEFCA